MHFHERLLVIWAVFAHIGMNSVTNCYCVIVDVRATFMCRCCCSSPKPTGLFSSRIVKIKEVTLDDDGDDTRRVREGDTESFAAVVLDGLSSGTDVDMPCQSLLSMFLWRPANQPAVGSTTKRRLCHCADLMLQTTVECWRQSTEVVWPLSRMLSKYCQCLLTLVQWPAFVYADIQPITVAIDLLSCHVTRFTRYLCIAVTNTQPAGTSLLSTVCFSI